MEPVYLIALLWGTFSVGFIAGAYLIMQARELDGHD